MKNEITSTTYVLYSKVCMQVMLVLGTFRQIPEVSLYMVILHVFSPASLYFFGGDEKLFSILLTKGLFWF